MHRLWLVLSLLAVAACRKTQTQERFTVRPGFTVETVARAQDTGSIVAFTFDARGRLAVAPERKHPALLIDNDGDGVFETMNVLSTKVNTVQGLWFDGPTLYAVGNNEEGQVGLYRLSADSAGSIEQLATFEKRMGEHGPHDIRRAPDGFPTVLLGNNTGIPAERVDPASPLRGYKEWQLLDRYMDFTGRPTGLMAPGGTLARWNEDKRNFVLLAGGLRNAYNHAYHPDGDAFTFDSDTESDLDLPWYRAIRTVHVVPGGDYGWRSGSGTFPAYFYDTLPPMRELGRGSPVGVEFYQHHAYPPEFRGAFLEADWSRGRILVTRLVRSGATYRAAQAQPEELVTGEPLNVTDIEVGPDGCVYFSTGGRDTEGGVYRIRYAQGFWERLFAPPADDGILAIVRQPQPLSSWGHAALEKKRDQMGARWGEELEKLARDKAADGADRVQALLLLQRFGPKPTANLLRPLSQDGDARVRAAAVYVVGLHGSPRAKAIAAAAFKDRDPFVRRRAAEAAVRMGLAADQPSFVPLDDIYALLGDPDRFVRFAGRVALERTPREDWRNRVLADASPAAALEGLLALLRTREPEEDLEPVFERLLALLARKDLPAAQRLAALRLFGIAAAEANSEAGLRATLRKQVSDILLRQFPDPAKSEVLNRELARAIAYCGQPEGGAAIWNAMPAGEENPSLQIHYVYCLRTMREGWTAQGKQDLVRWFQKAAKWRGGAGFTGYLNLMFESALAVFTEAEKSAARARVPEFVPAAAGAVKIPRARGTQSIRAREILEFQMFDPMTLTAKPEQGRELFEKECASCHRFGSLGADFGPDLSSLRSRFKKRDILEAMLWPSKTVSDQYRSVVVETKDGDAINGLLVREDGQRLVLKTADVAKPLEIAKSNVKARRNSEVSIMPEGVLDAYDQAAISSLIAFLLAGPAK